MSLGGNLIPVQNLAEALQVAFDAEAEAAAPADGQCDRSPDDSR